MKLLREVAIVALYELKSMLISLRTALFLVVYGGALYFAGYVYTKIARELESRAEVLSGVAKTEEFQKMIQGPAEWLGGPGLVSALMSEELPWSVLFVLLFSTVVLPSLILLVTYDRISDDLGSGVLRFTLQRVHRGTYLIGKLVGHFATVMILIGGVHLLFLLAASQVKELDPEAIAAFLPKLWLAMCFFVLAYVCFSSVFSALVRVPFASLALGMSALMGLWFFSLWTPLKKVWIGTWDIQLWILEPAAMAVFIGNAAVFGLLAYAILKWRDL